MQAPYRVSEEVREIAVLVKMLVRTLRECEGTMPQFKRLKMDVARWVIGCHVARCGPRKRLKWQRARRYEAFCAVAGIEPEFGEVVDWAKFEARVRELWAKREAKALAAARDKLESLPPVQVAAKEGVKWRVISPE